MRVMVTGSRYCSIEDELKVWRVLDQLDPDMTFLILGDAKGVDRSAKDWAQREGYFEDGLVEVYTADWELYDKKAGVLRNEDMVDIGEPDLVVAFPGPRSVGTWHAIKYAAGRGIEVRIYPIGVKK